MQTKTKPRTGPGTHLTSDDRIRIETLLDQKFSVRNIARLLNRPPSTISREIEKHRKKKRSKSCDCTNFATCKFLRVCSSTSCNRRCRECPQARKHCSDYVKSYCDIKMASPLELCNGCHKRTYCAFEMEFYTGRDAQKEYRTTLVEARNGFALTDQELENINALVSPRIKKGQSVYHIIQSTPGLPSESTLRRMVASGVLSARDIDLRDKVSRRFKTKPGRRKLHGESDSRPLKAGREYNDFLKYMMNNPDTPVVEMDCVEGCQEDKAAILTLFFVTSHLQLMLMLDEHTEECVVGALDKLEEALGYELFSTCFPVILTDNGHEFWDIEGMENSLLTENKRTRIFFCEPNRSDEKGGCETNHKHIRYVIPKGSSIEHLTQMDMSVLMDHVNSHIRRSLYGRAPYDVAMAIMPEEFFINLGLTKILPEEVHLKPDLLPLPELPSE